MYKSIKERKYKDMSMSISIITIICSVGICSIMFNTKLLYNKTKKIVDGGIFILNRLLQTLIVINSLVVSVFGVWNVYGTENVHINILLSINIIFMVITGLFIVLKEKVFEMNKELSDKDKELSDKDKELSDKDKELSDKDKELSDKDKEYSNRMVELSNMEKELKTKEEQLLKEREQINEIEVENLTLEKKNKTINCLLNKHYLDSRFKSLVIGKDCLGRDSVADYDTVLLNSDDIYKMIPKFINKITNTDYNDSMEVKENFIKMIINEHDINYDRRQMEFYLKENVFIDKINNIILSIKEKADIIIDNNSEDYMIIKITTENEKITYDYCTPEHYDILCESKCKKRKDAYKSIIEILTNINAYLYNYTTTPYK